MTRSFQLAFRWLLGLFAVCALMTSGIVHGQAKTTKFDHLSASGFALDTTHARATCETCHVKGVFKGTPKTCEGCHSTGSRVVATPMSAAHLPTTQACDTCHKTSGWLGAKFSHSGVVAGSCATCHNGTTARGKSPSHIVTSASCDTCHKTTSFTPASFSHASVSSGTCTNCHNGTSARGKTANHIATTQSCDTCHKTNAWTPASFHRIRPVRASTSRWSRAGFA